MPELAHAPEAAPAPPQSPSDDSFVYTPVDSIGMPLPLAPQAELRADRGEPQPDRHHHFHPRKSIVLTRDLGGQAIRNLRLQKSDYRTHHIDYHRYYDGPPLPETPQEQFGIVLLGSAGYVPERAIRFHEGQPEEVPLTTKQRQLLWDRGDLYIASTKAVKDFIVDYTTSQDIIEVDERLVDEFLNTPNAQRRYHLGGRLLQLAIEKATEPIDPFYRTAWKKGLIPRESSSRATRLIKNRLRLKQPHAQKNLIDMLGARLETLAA